MNNYDTICDNIKNGNFSYLLDADFKIVVLFLAGAYEILKSDAENLLAKKLINFVLTNMKPELISFYRNNSKQKMEILIHTFKDENITDDFIKEWINRTDEHIIYAFLKELSNNYYNKAYDEDIQIPDKNFDRLEKYAKIDRNIKLGFIGASTEREVLLPIPMGSMDKIKLDTTNLKIDRELVNKLKKVPKCKEFVLQDKLDGLSGLFEYNGDTKELKLYTRGTGITGQDISYLIPYINNLPTFNEIQSKFSEPDNIFYVKGELIMKKSVFNKYYTNASNPRNSGTGIINRDPKTALATLSQRQDIDFIAFELDENKPNNILNDTITQNDILITLGFTPVKSVIVNRNDITIKYLEIMLDLFKSESNYDIDGIIIKCNESYNRLGAAKNPTNAFAFKKDKIGVKTVVKSILWELGKLGVYKPTILIEPVIIDGKTISKVSGHNIDYIVNNEIYKDAVVTITIAGDVIPTIQEVIKPDNMEYSEILRKKATIYESIPMTNIIDENTVGEYYKNFQVMKVSESNEIRPIIYTKELISTQIFPKKLLSLISVKEIKIKKISLALVTKIGIIFEDEFFNVSSFTDVESQCQDVLFKFLNWTMDTINSYTEFGSSNATKVRANLYDSIIKILSAEDKYIISGFGVLGGNFGILTLNNFIDYEYDVELNNLEEILAFISESEQDFETLVSIFSRIPRVGITTAEQFVANAPLALTFIESINDIRKSKGITQSKSKSENITQNPMIKSKNFVITGKKEPLKSIIESNGGKVAANVSGTTDIAIYAGESKSEKVINKWEPLLLDERYKFRIMSEAEFRKEFNI